MNLSSVSQISALGIDPEGYDLAIFASGFERRATFFAKIFEKPLSKRTFVWGFDTDTDVLSRKDNDTYFANAFGIPPIPLHGATQEQQIFMMLRRLLQESEGPIRIFVDYTVMTRTWYGAILAYLNSCTYSSRVTIDFAYAIGRYSAPYQPLQIEDVNSISGFEGHVAGMRRSFSIFGLGFDKYATLAVLDRLEPDLVTCIVAWDIDSDVNSGKTLEDNKEILSNSRRIILPLEDVEATFRTISENLTAVEPVYQTSLVPMGPKTHVLACLLAASRMRQASCLHARGRRAVQIEVSPSGRSSVCRVTYL